MPYIPEIFLYYLNQSLFTKAGNSVRPYWSSAESDVIMIDSSIVEHMYSSIESLTCWQHERSYDHELY